MWSSAPKVSLFPLRSFQETYLSIGQHPKGELTNGKSFGKTLAFIDYFRGTMPLKNR